MSHYRIFVAEDNSGDVFLIEEALREHGVPYELTVAVDGEQASDLLQRITAAQENNCPDLILLDLNLPRLDGITVLEIIRQHEQCANIPVAVLTSSSAPSDRERVLSLGIETFIQKPVNFDDFLAIGGTLKDILSSRSTRS